MDEQNLDALLAKVSPRAERKKLGSATDRGCLRSFDIHGGPRSWRGRLLRFTCAHVQCEQRSWQALRRIIQNRGWVDGAHTKRHELRDRSRSSPLEEDARYCDGDLG